MRDEDPHNGRTREVSPDPDATGSAEGLPVGRAGDPGREIAEREAASRRAAARAHEATEGCSAQRDPYQGLALAAVAHRAFAALADNVRDYAIFLLDPDGIITFWGEGARLIKWWTKEQAEGAHLRLLYPAGGSEDGTAEGHLRAAARSGEYTGEGHRIRADGSTFWAGVTLTSLRDPEGRLLGFAKVTRDLTAQRAADAARRAALESAEEASRLKSLFLATMSHEIRTPLNSIMAYSDLLTMQLAGPLNTEQHDQLGKIRTSSQHLLGIVDDVLDLSRIEAGRLVARRERVCVGTAISQALSLVEPQTTQRSIELVDAVSDFSARLFCWGDEERIRQILLNLLSNAAKFTAPGGRITVSAGSAADPAPDATVEGGGPWIYVRVEDTGGGIPPERMEAVFEPFVQADMSFTRQHGGAGLGLSISRSLARLMGGDLTVRSEVGMGSTFFLWLPAAPEADAPVASMEESPAAGRPDTLREVRNAVVAELERILHAYVARLKRDPAIRSARRLPEAELEDHLASFLVDVAQTLGSLGQGGDPEAARDGTAIQRTVAERHGLQRARLGWQEDEVRREFQILREELAAAVGRRVRRPREEEVAEAVAALDELVEQAERISMRSFREARPK
jgi:PAS domain S-box-containing protein